MYVRIYVCTFACMHACVHACMYVCMNVCVYIYICMPVCMYVCMYVCMHISIHGYTCAFVCIYKYVCVHVYVLYVCVRICQYIYIYIYVSICVYIQAHMSLRIPLLTWLSSCLVGRLQAAHSFWSSLKLQAPWSTLFIEGLYGILIKTRLSCMQGDLTQIKLTTSPSGFRLVLYMAFLSPATFAKSCKRPKVWRWQR